MDPWLGIWTYPSSSRDIGCSGSRISLIKSKISRASNSSLFIGYWMVMWHDSCQPHGVAKWPLDGAFPYIFIPIMGTFCSFTLLIKKRRRCVLKNCVYTCENHTTESELRHYYYVIKWHPSQQDIKKARRRIFISFWGASDFRCYKFRNKGPY